MKKVLSPISETKMSAKAAEKPDWERSCRTPAMEPA